MAAERQQHDRLQGIERGHLQRYLWATQFIKPEHRVLDVACGCGYGTFLLALAADYALGADRSDEAIAHAQRHFQPPNVRGHIGFQRTDAYSDFGGNFDLVVSFETIEHLEDPPRFLLTVMNQLKPSGNLLLSHPAHDTGVNEFHLYIFSDRDMEKMLTAAGFQFAGPYYHVQDKDGVRFGDQKRDERHAYTIWHCYKP